MRGDVGVAGSSIYSCLDYSANSHARIDQSTSATLASADFHPAGAQSSKVPLVQLTNGESRSPNCVGELNGIAAESKKPTHRNGHYARVPTKFDG